MKVTMRKNSVQTEIEGQEILDALMADDNKALFALKKLLDKISRNIPQAKKKDADKEKPLREIISPEKLHILVDKTLAPNKKKKKKRSLFKLTRKKHHCPQCKIRFQPTGNSQRFCSSKCRDLWEQLKKKRKSRIAPQEKKAMFVGNKPKIEPIVNKTPNQINDSGHVTGKKYRSAENNPFL